MAAIIRALRNHRNDFRARMMVISIASLLVLSLFAGLIIAFPMTQSFPSRTLYTSHAPIFINGDAGFLGLNSSTGISWGSGTVVDPFIIEGWDINSTGFLIGINIGNSTAHFVVRDCMVHDATQLEILLDNVTGGRLLRDECTSTQDGYSIYVRDSDHCLIENVNSSANSYGGLYLFNSDNNTIRNNTSSDSLLGNGIYLFNSTVNDLENNSCLRNQNYGIVLSASCADRLINNTCSSNYCGIVLGLSALGTSDTNLVINNTCYDNYYGIFLYTSSGNTIDNNTCSGNGNGMEISTSCSSNTINNNNCSNNTDIGIEIGYSAANAASNNICLNNEIGIHLYGSAHNILLNNTCSNNANGGIYLDASSNNNTISYNNCSDEYQGIFVGFFTCNNDFSFNTCSFDGYGLYFDQYSNLDNAFNNTCTDNNYGICLQQSNSITLNNNNCSNNDDGIYLLNSDVNVISNNTCSDNNAGIYLSNSYSNTISNNTCSNNMNDGIYIRGSSNVIDNNTCFGNSDKGIYVSYSGNEMISHNNCSYNVDGIFLIQSFDSILSYNTCLNNANTSIYLFDSSYNNVISNNTCSNNQYGLVLDLSASNNELTNNYISNNTLQGLCISSGSTNLIWNNSFFGNNGAIAGIHDPAHNQALDNGAGSSWNTIGTPHGYGNMWGDMLGPDNNRDGIVDVPYYIDGGAGSLDNYPIALWVLKRPMILNSPPTSVIFPSSYLFHALANSPDNSSSIWDLRTDAPWLSMTWNNETECIISGTPLSQGIYWANLTVSDFNSTDYINWTINVHATSLGPIRINSDLEFASMALSSGWPGDGTSINPYVISDYFIDATGYLASIYIGNTTVYFVISNCTLYNTLGSGNDSSAGVLLNNVTHGRLTNNNCSSNLIGICLGYSDLNIIENNHCFDDYYGIALMTSSINIIGNNSCRWNDAFGIFLSNSSDLNLLTNNTCTSNSGSGISLFSQCKNNMIFNNTCSFSIELDGITLVLSCDDNLIIGNDCSSNYYFGIDFIYSCSRNVISMNRIYDNRGFGIGILYTNDTGNRILGNALVGNNGAGAFYSGSHAQAYDSGWDNWWNSTAGYGNYWSDWTTPDNTAPFGIVDMPYEIPGGAFSTDCYPMTALPGTPDIYPPMTVSSLSGTSGTNEWYRSSVSLNLSANDWDYGVNATYYRLGASGNWTVYSSDMQLSTEGDTTVQFYSRDNAGNDESVQTITIRIDTLSPVTSATVSNSILTLVAVDNTSGASQTYYRVDGGSWIVYSGPISVTGGGDHTVEYYSTDIAGNIESVRSINVRNTGILGLDFILWIVIIVAAIAAALIIVVIVVMRKSRTTVRDLNQSPSFSNMPAQVQQVPGPTVASPPPISQPQVPSAVKFCPYCGAPSRPEWPFCGNCGSRLS